MYLTQSTCVETKERKVKKLDPFKMPVSTEVEEYLDYVCAVKPDAPFEYCQIGPVSFEKRVISSEASYVQNQEKHYDYGVLVRKFTEKQAEAIKSRSKEKVITIPRKSNKNWKRDSDEMEYFPAFDVLVSDWITFIPVKDFNPVSDFYENREKILHDSKDEVENSKEELYSLQGKGRKK